MSGQYTDDESGGVSRANGIVSHDEPVWFEVDRNEQPSEAVIRGVSTATGQEPRSFDPLYDYVDPDALDALLENSDPVNVQFEFEGCHVTLRSEGSVLVHVGTEINS